MAAQFKLTIKRGQTAKDVARSSGTAITGSDAIEVNIDATNMSKLDAVLMLRQVIQEIVIKGFPQ
jgi:hypothetical protein